METMDAFFRIRFAVLRFPALPAFLVASGLCACTLSAHAANQCRAAEATYFSCSSARHLTLSLCGAVPASLQYRYGKSPHTELAFPDDPADGAHQLLYAHYSRFQTERSEVTFNHAGVDYAVFDYIELGKRSAGVHITMPDGTEHEVLCTGPVEGQLSTLARSLHCDADNALNGGKCP